MRINRLRLVNFRNYEDFTVEFGDGVIGLVGPNGCGKSTVLFAVKWLLFGSLPASRGELLRDGAAARAEAYACGEFSHGDLDLRITRRLDGRAPVATLECSGRPPIEGDKNVTAAVAEILGATAAVGDAVVVEQKRLITLFDEQPAKRLDRLQKQLDLERFAQIYSAIHKRVSSILAQYGQDAPVVRSNAAAKASAEDRRDADLQKLAGLSPEADLLARIAEIDQAIPHAIAAERAAAAAAKLPSLRAKVQELTASAAAADADAERAETALLAARDAAMRSAREKELARGREAIRARRVSLMAEIAEHENSLTLWTNLENPGLTAEEAASCLESVQAQRRRELDRASLADSDECPVCHTPVSKIGLDVVANAAQMAADLEQEASRLSWALRQAELWSQRSQSLAWFTGAKLKAEQALRELPDPGPEPAEAVISVNLGAKEAEARVHRNVAKSLNAALSDAKAALAAAEADAVAAVAKNHPTHDALTRERDLVKNALYERRACEASIRSAEGDIAAAQRWLDEADKRSAWADRLCRMEPVYHREGVPGRLLVERLRDLETVMNEFLADFGAFQAEVSDTADLYAVFPDGTRRHQSQLSGGQETVLTIAYVLAMNAVVTNAIGLIGLDEPTVWLDQDRVRAFAGVIRALRNYAQSQGIQCLIVTHSQELAPLFDQLVVLGQ